LAWFCFGDLCRTFIDYGNISRVYTDLGNLDWPGGGSSPDFCFHLGRLGDSFPTDMEETLIFRKLPPVRVYFYTQAGGYFFSCQVLISGV
jgi:hypothetical protein